MHWDEIVQKTASDPSLKNLLIVIESGFDTSLFEIEIIREYIPFRESYYIHDGVILYHDRIVLPASHRQKVLSTIHAAHQEVSAMERRARAVVFWPGMMNDGRCVRDVCVYCSRNAPSQTAPPPMPSNPPWTPFEQNFAGYFDYGGRIFWLLGIKSQAGLTYLPLFRVRASLAQLH